MHPSRLHRQNTGKALWVVNSVFTQDWTGQDKIQGQSYQSILVPLISSFHVTYKWVRSLMSARVKSITKCRFLSDNLSIIVSDKSLNLHIFILNYNYIHYKLGSLKKSAKFHTCILIIFWVMKENTFTFPIF